MSYREIILKSPQSKNYNVRVVRNTKERNIYVYTGRETHEKKPLCVCFHLARFRSIIMLSGKYSV